MNVQTLSILVGGSACNAKCPYCVSRMTPNELPSKAPEVNWERFRIARRLAECSGATVAMLTGKGEPTLWPDLIRDYLRELYNSNIPIVELQTNGIRLASPELDDHLERWMTLGLTTVALSVASWSRDENESIYGKSYSVGKLVDKLHGYGFSVRLCCSMLKGMIDNTNQVHMMIGEAKIYGAEQLTFTPINYPKGATGDVAEFARKHFLTGDNVLAIKEYLDEVGALLCELPHGARVYDVGGQNVALNNCLTGKPVTNTIRNLIFHPDGAIRFTWEHEGSRLL